MNGFKSSRLSRQSLTQQHLWKQFQKEYICIWSSMISLWYLGVCLISLMNLLFHMLTIFWMNVYILCIRLTLVNYTYCSYLWSYLTSFIATDKFKIFCVKPQNNVSITAMLLIKIYHFYKNCSMLITQQLNHRMCYSHYHYICFSYRNWRCQGSKNII